MSATPNHPCRTIDHALNVRVAAEGRSKIIVADGVYDGTVTLSPGIDLLGGHRPDTWERHASSTLTIPPR